MYEQVSAAHEESDASLLKKYAGSGSTAAFDALVRRHFGFVSSVCLRCLGDRQLAEDATQVVFIVLSRKASSLKSREFLPAWLFQTARLTARDMRRREARRACYEGMAARETARASMNAASWVDVEPVIDDLLARLKADERNALLLRFYQEEEFAAIAGSFGISEQAARMRVSRALGKLRGWLQQEGIGVTTVTLLGWLGVDTVNQLTQSPGLVSHVLNPSPTDSTLLISKGVLKTLSAMKLTAIAATAIATAVVVGGGFAVARYAYANGNGSSVPAHSTAGLAQAGNPGGLYPQAMPASEIWRPGPWVKTLADGSHVRLTSVIAVLNGQKEMTAWSPDSSSHAYFPIGVGSPVQSDLIWMKGDDTADARVHTFLKQPLMCIGISGLSDSTVARRARPYSRESIVAVMDRIAPAPGHPNHIDITVDIGEGPFTPLLESSFTSGETRRLSDGSQATITKAIRHSGQPAHDSAGNLIDITAFTVVVPDRFVSSACEFNLDAIDDKGQTVNPNHGGYGEVDLPATHSTQLLCTFRTKDLDDNRVQRVRFGYRHVDVVTFRDVALDPTKPTPPIFVTPSAH